MYVHHSRVTADTGYLLRSGVDIKIGQNPQNLIELKYFNPLDKVLINTKSSKVTSLKNSPVVLGRDSSATLVLDTAAISRRHATMDKDNRGRYILRDHSTNGVFVNGQRVKGSTVLEENADIRIGSFTFVVRGDELLLLDQGNHIRLDACNLVLETKGKRCLDNVSFAIEIQMSKRW